MTKSNIPSNVLAIYVSITDLSVIYDSSTDKWYLVEWASNKYIHSCEEDVAIYSLKRGYKFYNVI